MVFLQFSSAHIVTKKGLSEDGNPKLRMVIDFRKLNEKTIPDRYPIPDTSVILANLGKSAIFHNFRPKIRVSPNSASRKG